MATLAESISCLEGAIVGGRFGNNGASLQIERDFESGSRRVLQEDLPGF